MRSQRVRSLSIALACFAFTLSACEETLAQICRPVSERTGESGCWIIANEALGQLPQQPIYWHLDTYPTRAQAETARERVEPLWSRLGKCGFSRSTWRDGALLMVRASRKSDHFQSVRMRNTQRSIWKPFSHRV